MARSPSSSAAAARHGAAAAGGGGVRGRGLYLAGNHPATSALWQQVAQPIRNLVASLLSQL